MNINIQGRSLMTTNPSNNKCTWEAKHKQRSSGTEQPELFFNDNTTTHNIYFIESTCLSSSLRKLEKFNKPKKPGKSIWLNVFGQADSLKVSVGSIKSYTKDFSSNIWVSIVGRNKPIQVRNSILEIESLILGAK
tara:strand:- start:2152 stop:2556 length:405 start_codon:yes stop_codon:yes gene_type:complete